MYNAYSLQVNKGESDRKFRHKNTYALVQFEDLNGNTGEDGNVLFLVDNNSGRLQIAVTNIALQDQINTLKFPGPRNHH
jgi:hypothetical protein